MVGMAAMAAALMIVLGTAPAQAIPQRDFTTLPGYEVVTSNQFFFNPAGASAGWSCPAGKVVLGAEFVSGAFQDFSSFQPTKPGDLLPSGNTATSYGWFLKASVGVASSGVQINLFCADPPPGYKITQSNVQFFSGQGGFSTYALPTPPNFTSGGGYRFENADAAAAQSEFYEAPDGNQGWKVTDAGGGRGGQGYILVISLDDPAPPPTTTTTTTTVPAATTTIPAPTTTRPTTTTPTRPTTTIPAPTTSAAPTTTITLPATGGGSMSLVLVGLVLAAVGTLALLVGRTCRHP